MPASVPAAFPKHSLTRLKIEIFPTMESEAPMFFLLSMNIESTMENDVPRRKSQTPESPSTDGAAPSGAVADGRARNPPPIVVPAIRAAEDASSSSKSGIILRLRLHFLCSWRSFDLAHREAPQARKHGCHGGVSPSHITTGAIST